MAEGVTVEAAITALGKGPRDTGTRLSGFAALSTDLGGGSAIGRVRPWTVLADPHLFVRHADVDTMAVLSEGGRALGDLVNDISTTYGFWWYVGGAALRTVVYGEGELLEDMGERLPEELGLPDPTSEVYAFELMERLTGLTLNDLLEHDDFHLVRKDSALSRFLR